MAQDITLLGASYEDVPAVELPKTGGGTASFTDVTDTTAAAADVAQGKYFYTAAGVKTEGTASGGGGGIETKDVNFYDYDGELLYSYTAQEFLALSAFPANPTHSGLTAQGWNWSLSDAKAYVTKYGMLEIGQMYATTSGATEIDITLESPYLTPYIRARFNGSATVDWGDGSTPTTWTSTSIWNDSYHSHTYLSAGNYTISIKMDSGTIEFAQGGNANNSGILVPINANSSSHKYSRTITAIRIGSNVTFGARTFNYCTSMRMISIPNTISALPDNCFSNCFSLQGVAIPNSITSIVGSTFVNCYSLKWISLSNFPSLSSGNSMFNNCYSLERVTVPDDTTSIPQNTFSNCRSLKKITLPDTIDNFGGNSAFDACSSLREINIPNPITSIKNTCFRNCYLLEYAQLPDDVTEIAGSAFEMCYSLFKITIPEDVTSILSGAFNQCISMQEYHLLPTTPPTLANTYAFNAIPPDCIIYVPYSEDHSILAAYQGATNWSNFASYMQEEPA